MSDKAKILLFELEETFAEELRQTLTEFGYSAPLVVCAREQLLDVTRTSRPDLIMAGISLKGWLDCIEAVEETGARFDVPIIYLSYQADTEIFDRSLSSAPFAFLLKPFNSIQLCYTIEIALARHGLEKCSGSGGVYYRDIFELSGSAMMVLDDTGTVLMVNRAFEHLSGYTSEMILGCKKWDDFFLDELSEMIGGSLSPGLEAWGTATSELPVLFVGNQQRSKSVFLRVKPLNGSGRYIASMFDIAEIKTAEKEIHALNSELMRMNSELRRELSERENYEKLLLHQANHDSLTGLPNRQLLYDRFNQAVAYVGRNNSMLALLLVDLDNFKHINDSLGHIAGDVLLKEVAGRLQACLRKYDTVARFGGDEFVIIANDMQNIHDIVRFVDKVYDKFQHSFDILGKPVCATASIGLAICPLQSCGIERLLKMADAAMYQVKYEGGNAYRFFTEAMNLKLDRRAQLENRLSAALDREEYFAHYQPRIDVATRKIVGMEALMRWQPIDGPLAYPADFFQVLEECGMIVPVGEWMLEKVCEQNRAWHDSGLPQLRVAVNVSERQFLQDDFAERVSSALSNARLEPRFLEIELPEQIVMNNVAESISRLKKLKSTGVSISVDNFGTGYSSLSHLSRLPIDDIQIDKSLINNIITGEDDANVVSAIISIGHSLGKNLIAEGVESEQQYVFLAERQCRQMQGHFFSRPLTPIEFEKMVRQYIF